MRNPSIERLMQTRKSTVMCEFCGKECGKDKSMSFNEYWRCSNHSNVIVKYLVAEAPDTWYTKVILCKSKEKMYHVSWFFDNPAMKEKFRIDEVKPVATQYGTSAAAIFSLDFYPEGITPDNVIEKIGKWIIFS